MRKLLLSLVMIVLIVIMAFTMKEGIKVGAFELPGFQEIEKKNDELTELIAKANSKKEEYQGSLDLLESDAATMAKAKKEYLDLVQVSTDSDIKEALQTKTYTIEYLWSRVGNYAAKEGINLKMDLTSSTVGYQDYRNLSFTLEGKYLQIISYIDDIENDADLDFIIDNFSMKKSDKVVEGDKNIIEEAKFTVKDIKLEGGTTQTSFSVNNSTTDTESDENNSTTDTELDETNPTTDTEIDESSSASTSGF